MNGFQLKEYWRYRRAAKGRHGVHSPAVYRFIEEALRPAAKRFANTQEYISDAGAVWQADMLLRRIVQHFRFREIVIPAVNGGQMQLFHASQASYHQNHEGYDRLFHWQSFAPEIWSRGFEGTEPYWGPRDVVAIDGIHQSAAHVAAWKALCERAGARLSIDLFRVGLLFFSDDFKERQHFVLKYPA